VEIFLRDMEDARVDLPRVTLDSHTCGVNQAEDRSSDKNPNDLSSL
jgi:hypothetical protein